MANAIKFFDKLKKIFHFTPFKELHIVFGDFAFHLFRPLFLERLASTKTRQAHTNLYTQKPNIHTYTHTYNTHLHMSIQKSYILTNFFGYSNPYIHKE